jgi:hypothetical protein
VALMERDVLGSCNRLGCCVILSNPSSPWANAVIVLSDGLPGMRVLGRVVGASPSRKVGHGGT